jgi:hypothetical protein
MSQHVGDEQRVANDAGLDVGRDNNSLVIVIEALSTFLSQPLGVHHSFQEDTRAVF